ncbi:MAG: thiamine pyrophosphate-dependent dehydrogenase E1 component subunit alpha [Planctomycetes bacterium]|nr:thiamine pyrophosphate-dependent dehydrogenase E1 component subunit alpha [Planctomycetota bacterium]
MKTKPKRVIGTAGKTCPVNDPRLSGEIQKQLYRWMALIRAFDTKMLGLQRQGRIGFYGPIKGQEAATVGSAAAFEKDDWIFPALREGGVTLMRGFPMEKIVAQLIGNAGDACRGRQMPCHYTFREGHYVSMSSVIATQLPHAVGAAYAARLRGHRIVVAAYLGDGATSENDFHTAMNFAGVWRVPVVFVCQNNQWAISVPFEKQTAASSIAVKASAYGFEGVRVDGNDVLAVYSATRAAADKARAGGGPALVECLTYRMEGHSSSDDPTKYRPAGEAESWVDKDPIARFRRHLESLQLWSDEDESSFQSVIADAIAQAVDTAERFGPPSVASLFEDVCSNGIPPHLREQLAEVSPAVHRP